MRINLFSGPGTFGLRVVDSMFNTSFGDRSAKRAQERADQKGKTAERLGSVNSFSNWLTGQNVFGPRFMALFQARATGARMNARSQQAQPETAKEGFSRLTAQFKDAKSLANNVETILDGPPKPKPAPSVARARVRPVHGSGRTSGSLPKMNPGPGAGAVPRPAPARVRKPGPRQGPGVGR